MLSGMRKLLSPGFLLVTVLCSGVAFAMCMLCRDNAVKAAVPVTFLLALVPVAYLVGRMASLFVAIVAGFIFAVCLFEPYGSLAIRSAVDRMELLCFGVAAIVVVHFSPSQEALAKTALRRYSGREPLSSLSESGGTLVTSDPLETWIAVVGYAVAFMAIVTLLLYIW